MNYERQSGTALTSATTDRSKAAGPAMTDDQGGVADKKVVRSTSPFGQRVVLGRRAAGLTRGELSGRSGVSRSYIARIERGCANPTLETMVKLADALGSELAEMLLAPADEAGQRPVSGQGSATSGTTRSDGTRKSALAK